MSYHITKKLFFGDETCVLGGGGVRRVEAPGEQLAAGDGRPRKSDRCVSAGGEAGMPSPLLREEGALKESPFQRNQVPAGRPGAGRRQGGAARALRLSPHQTPKSRPPAATSAQSRRKRCGFLGAAARPATPLPT